jgi:hypothetical protein
MSVPPVIEESWTFCGNALYTYSNDDGGRTEPVDMMSRNLESWRVDFGMIPPCSRVPMYFALVPKAETPS